MDTKETLGVISVVLGCAGFVPYVRDIFKRRTNPHVFSWIIWTIIAGIVSLAQMRHNAGPGMWATGFGFLGCLFIAVVALFLGEKDIKKSDVVAFIASLSAILLWVLTGQALLAVILSAIIEVLSFYPTFRKSYTKPDQETALMYALGGLRSLLSLLALEDFSLVNALFPISVMVMNTAFVCMVLWRRRLALGYSS